MRRSAKLAGAGLAVSVLALAGCSGSGSDDDDGITLQFWTHTHDPMNVLLEQIIEDYEAENQDVTIEYTVMPNSDFFTRMLTSLSTGAGPDIININDVGLRGEYIPNGLVAPIDPEGFGEESAADVAARYVGSSLDGVSDADGTVYGVPSEFNAMAFAINTEHFRDAGLDPDAALESWDDVIAAGEALAAAGHTQGFSFNYLHADSYTEQLSMLLSQTGGSIVAPDGLTQTIDQPESVAALELWNTLSTSGIGDPNVTTKDANNQVADFEAGIQSMMAIYPWGMAQIAQNNPDVYEQLKVVPLPQVDLGAPTSHAYAYYWAVNQASDQQVEAWRFIDFMSSYSDQWLTDVSFIQPFVGWEDSEAAAQLDAVDVWAEAYADARFQPVGAHWAEVQDVIMNAINDIVFNGADPQETADSIADTIQQSLAE